MLLKAKQIIDMLKRNISRLISYKFISVYIIGSLASGDYVEGRSDCDIVVVTQEKLNIEEEYIYNGSMIVKKDAMPEENIKTTDLKITIYYRSYKSIINSIKNLLEYDITYKISGKELGCVEDAILISGQGILLAGKDIRGKIILPNSLQFGCYLQLLEKISEKDYNEDVVRLMLLSKNILLYAKHYYYMWTHNICYNSGIIKIMKSKFPEFKGIDIMKQANKITQMNWIQCRVYLIRNPDILEYIETAYADFIFQCNSVCANMKNIPSLDGMNGRKLEMYKSIYPIKEILLENQLLYNGLLGDE